MTPLTSPESWEEAQRRVRQALLTHPVPATVPEAGPAQEAPLAALDLRTVPVEGRDRALGALALPVKRQLHRLLRPWLIDRQSDFNAAVADRLQRMEERLETLAAQAPTPRPSDEAKATMEAVGYIEFEAAFRGSEEAIAARQAHYADHFDPARPVLDVGCGRGDFLEVLVGRGVDARGIDLDAEAVRRARQRGLPVEFGDASGYLGGVPAGSLGGVFVSQVVEHLSTPELIRLLHAAHQALAEGGVLIVETLNPESWPVLSRWFPLDPTHVRLVHPETLQFLVRRIGMSVKALEFCQDQPEATPVTAPDVADGIADRLDTIGRKLFGPLDYCLIAVK